MARAHHGLSNTEAMQIDTTAPGARDLVTIWSALAARVASLLDDAEAVATLRTPVPAAGPEIRLGQLVGHMVASLRRLRETGSAGSHLRCDPQSILSDVPGIDGTLGELCELWRAEVAAVTEPVRHAPNAAVTELICEDVMHEHDLRMALDRAGARDSDAIKVALDALSAQLSQRVVEAGLTALRVTVEQWGTVVGAGPTYDCVVADRFELVRGMAGRRSASEMARWNWSADPTRYVAVISATGRPRDTELRERDPRVPEHMRDREFVL